MASPESRSNWTPFRESGIPESAMYFSPQGNGLDIIRPTDHSGYIYEDQCFLTLAEKFPEHFIIGAHLIDYIQGKFNPFKGNIVPDSLFLQSITFDDSLTPGVFGKSDMVVLSGFSEFKSGKSLGLQRKVDGFMDLLNKLRKNPDKLLTALQETIGEYVEIPSKILIPDNSSFQISLVKPDEKRSEVKAPEGITLEYITIPIAA